MAERRIETSVGTLRILGWQEEWMDWAAELGLKLASGGTSIGQFVTARGERAYLKGAPLLGRSRARHAWRARLLRIEPPRLTEYVNLSWLTERLFQTPLPLAAGALTRRGETVYQFLATAEVPQTTDLKQYLAERQPGRAAVLDELARELARMHALHFVHRDLFPRNVLVSETRGARRVFFLDAWRGGCRLQSRGSAYDLACFFLHAPELLDDGEQAAFFERYASERSLHGKPAPRGLARAIARQRAGLVRRVTREPGRLHGHAPPPLDWVLPAR